MVKRILFTAPDTYHTSLHKAFDERPACSFRPMFVPFISSTLLPPGATFLPFCNELETFDYIICSSIMAVRALASAGVDTSLIDGKVIAIGNDQNTVRQLLGIMPALPDAKPSMMGILDALKSSQSLQQKRIAVLWPKFCGLPVPFTITNFQEALDATGASISYVYCYRTSAMSEEYYAETADALRSGNIDAVAITSGGEAYVLSRILQFAQTQGKPINIPIYSFGPYTTRCAQEAHLKVEGTSPNHYSFADFIDYLSLEVIALRTPL